MFPKDEDVPHTLPASACVRVQSLSHVQLFFDAWTIAPQVPPSMGFSRQEYWSGLRSPPPGDLPNSGIKPRSPALQVDSLPSEPPGKPSMGQDDPCAPSTVPSGGRLTREANTEGE